MPGPSSSRFSSSSCAALSQFLGIARRFGSRRPPLPGPREKIVAATGFAPEFFLLFLQAHRFRSQRARLLHQALVGFPAAAELFRVFVGMNEIPDEIEQQFLENFKAVGIMNEIAEQDIILEQQGLVRSAFEKQKAVAKQLVKLRKFLAEKRAPRFRKRVFIQLAHDLVDRHAHLPINAAALGLQLGDSRPHHVRLLAAFEMHAARVNPFFALDDQARKLAANFAEQEFQHGEPIEDIHFDVLRVFRPRQ